ncbi:MAG TPA: hypothetical protein VFQ57_06490 [Sphingomonas sp.]|nr:hypothetical protein [Sphingomonas sp.]
MNVGGTTFGPGTAKLLYAGSAAYAATGGEKAAAKAKAAVTIASGRDIIEISDEAKAALAKTQGSADIGIPEAIDTSLKGRVNTLFKEARDRGTFITFDSSQGGEWMDLSSFTDDELAQIQLDRKGEFPKDLSIYAAGGLGQRMATSLEAFETGPSGFDSRGQAMAINALYDQMSTDVRAALGWTQTMMAANNRYLARDVERDGPGDVEDVLAKLMKATGRGGLRFSRPNGDTETPAPPAQDSISASEA